MAPLSSAISKTAQHPQRQKLILRKSCRKVRECSENLATGEVPSVEALSETSTALRLLYESCTGDDGKSSETQVEATLGSLPMFLGLFKDRLESTLGKIQEGSSTRHEEEGCKNALQNLLATTTECHQRMQQRDEDDLKARKAWEEENPIQMAQEHELSLYAESLQPLLDAPSARAISSNQWQEADKSLASLQLYLLDNKISAEQVRGREKNGIEPLLRHILRQMEDWDAEGLGFKKDDRVDIELVQKIWGRADKIGSGLNYLLVLDARGDSVEGVVSLHEIRAHEHAPNIPLAETNHEIRLPAQIRATSSSHLLFFQRCDASQKA